MRVQIGDLVFVGQPDETFNGLLVERGGLTDWYSLAPAKNPKEERPQDHGSFRRGKIFRQSKTITVKGWAVAGNRTQAFERRQTLVGLLAAEDELLMRVTDDFSTTERVVVVEDVDVPDNPTTNFEFAIDMTAEDPRRYDVVVPKVTGLPMPAGGASWPVSWPVSWGAVGVLGRVSSTNTGTADSVPLFQVTGGLPDGFLLEQEGTGRVIRFEGAIPVGSTLFLNPRTGRASLNGQADRSGLLTRSDWWSVAPGGTSAVRFSSLGGHVGDPELTVLFSSANW